MSEAEKWRMRQEIDRLREMNEERDGVIEMILLRELRLRELLVRVLVVEGRCPVRLLTEIRAALAKKEDKG